MVGDMILAPAEPCGTASGPELECQPFQPYTHTSSGEASTYPERL